MQLPATKNRAGRRNGGELLAGGKLWSCRLRIRCVFPHRHSLVGRRRLVVQRGGTAVQDAPGCRVDAANVARILCRPFAGNHQPGIGNRALETRERETHMAETYDKTKDLAGLGVST